MRIDHIAFRVANQATTALFFQKAMNYQISPKLPKGFRVDFKDSTFADCLVLTPPNRKSERMPWVQQVEIPFLLPKLEMQEYHQPPEIFISQGSPGSIVDRWVKENKGNGLHHIALQVDDIEAMQKKWQESGYARFSSDKPLLCPGLKQIFTAPSTLTGFIWELIEREPGEQGFCEQNVRNLMLSTDEQNRIKK
jgi:catechol 2,3-dioxygenase-like lactoylglutathione lyase family enzyme